MIIYLIGMMYSGKTTIGMRLAKMLNYDIIDTDKVIETTENLKVNDIIEEKGIDYFRKIESDVLRNLNLSTNTVVSTGGGIILNQENVLYMRNHGVVIYLNASLSILQMRHKEVGITNRPLLKNISLEKIFSEREALYKKASEIIIKTDLLSIDDICMNIIQQLGIQ